MSQTEEVWRSTDFPEHGIEVSNLGNVRRLLPNGNYKTAVTSVNNRGYRRVYIGKRQYTSVHQLVARAFLGSERHQLVRHLDGDALNNHVDNLAVGTSYENAIDTIEHGRHPQLRKTHCPHGHEYTEENTYRPPAKNWRYCRTCMKAAQHSAYLRRIAQKEAR